MIEKRRRTRVSFATRVVIKFENSEIETEASTQDVSLNGMFIESEDKIPLGTACSVKIYLPGATEDMALHIDGRVCRHAQSGVGINFEAMDPDSFSHLKNIAMYNSSDPDAIEDEILNIPLR